MDFFKATFGLHESPLTEEILYMTSLSAACGWSVTPRPDETEPVYLTPIEGRGSIDANEQNIMST